MSDIPLGYCQCGRKWKLKNKEIAKMFNVSESNIEKIVGNEIWRI